MEIGPDQSVVLAWSMAALVQMINDEINDSGNIASKMIKVGAEARIDEIEWQGIRAISKTRIPKSYRNSALDQRIRTRRMKEETGILYLAKLAGVSCPKVYFVNPKRSEIVMEYVEGELLRDLEERSRTAEGQKINDILLHTYKTLGKYAARLHCANLIHGDLTTKNVIVLTSDGRHNPVLIDFGLSFYSERNEDRAEDLHLLNQALKSTLDSNSAKTAFKLVIDGYRSETGAMRTRQVLDTISEIEKRGRYARVD
jgi:TP53 regulating kinase-like protein